MTLICLEKLKNAFMRVNTTILTVTLRAGHILPYDFRGPKHSGIQKTGNEPEIGIFLHRDEIFMI